jgi:hypothetical protein
VDRQSTNPTAGSFISSLRIARFPQLLDAPMNAFAHDSARAHRLILAADTP